MKMSINNILFQSLVVLMRVLLGVGWCLAGITKITGKTGEVSWYWGTRKQEKLGEI